MADMIIPASKTHSAERKKRLLIIVDGDGAYLYYTSILLQRLEYTIHTAKSVAEVLEIMGIALPSLILTEISLLGGPGGLELLRQIKKNPATKSIPVIICTSSKDAAVKEACLREGCEAYLPKPIDPDLLYAAIQKATETTPRQYIRLTTCLEVLVGNDPVAELAGISCVTALSENGMYVSTSKPLASGTQVPVAIFLPEAQVKAEGTVLYSFSGNEGPMRTPGMGIKFVRIRPEDQDRIRAFIRKELMQDLPGKKT